MPLGETHPDRRHTCLPSHQAHTHTHHLVHTPGLGSHWDDSCKLWRQGLSLVEKEEGEGKEEACVCGGGGHECVHVYCQGNQSLTQTSNARVTEGRGSTRRGAVGTRCTQGDQKRNAEKTHVAQASIGNLQHASLPVQFLAVIASP